MTDYSKNQIPSTISMTIITAGILTLIMPNVAPANNLRKPVYNSNICTSVMTLPTIDLNKTVVTGENHLQNDALEAALINVYTNLLARQESLGVEFEKVLYENLWNLYES